MIRLAILVCCLQLIIAEAVGAELLVCAPSKNALTPVLHENKIAFERVDSFDEAVSRATEGAGVLVLASGYPERRTHIDPTTLQRAQTKALRLYIEYPESLPGHAFENATKIKHERAIVTTGALNSRLPAMRILSVSGCMYLPTTASRTLMSIGKVAGYDTAVYGLPSNASPLLFELPDANALVATTCLSNFVPGRYGPAKEWAELWTWILANVTHSDIAQLKFTPAVHPAYARDAKVPKSVEQDALRASAEWLMNSQLLLTKPRLADTLKKLASGGEETPWPGHNAENGDGSYGVLEGYASQINYDGTQQQRLPLRADCQAESAMVLAFAGARDHTTSYAQTARNLLKFTYGADGFTSGPRADASNPAYGLIAWGIGNNAWETACYGDDNARAILATWAAGALLKSDDFDDAMLRAVVANFRTTGIKGFRGERIEMPDLAQKGWQHFAARDFENLSPHFEAYLWACYLVAYQQTKYEPFLTLVQKAAEATMAGYPARWHWQDTNERARMLLVVAWLLRVDDKPVYRQWLHRLTADLLEYQQPNGAIRDRLAGKGAGHFVVASSNETFGTGESPLIQQNGDPVSDQLYATGFTLIALHEAVAVTGDEKLRAAEDKLAEYLCRIQARSDQQPYLSGAWLRAFDYARWDYWASSGDIGWGPWCAEAGWGQAWISATLGLRKQKLSFWELLISQPASSNASDILREMLPAPK